MRMGWRFTVNTFIAVSIVSFAVDHLHHVIEISRIEPFTQRCWAVDWSVLVCWWYFVTRWVWAALTFWPCTFRNALGFERAKFRWRSIVPSWWCRCLLWMCTLSLSPFLVPLRPTWFWRWTTNLDDTSQNRKRHNQHLEMRKCLDSPKAPSH